METTLLLDAASRAGVIGPAVPDALARGLTYFAAKEPTQENLSAWIASLKGAAPHFFAPPARTTTVPEDLPAWLSPAEKMTRFRQLHPQTPVQRRPQPYTPTAEQLKSVEGKTPTERLSAYREWQAQAQGGTP